MERVDKALNWIGNNKRNLAAAGVLLPSALLGMKCAGSGENKPDSSTQAASLLQTSTPETPLTPASKLIDSANAISRPDKLGIGDSAPDFQLKSLDGKTVKLSDFKGKPVVVVTWADWAANFSNSAVSRVLDATSKAGRGDMVILIDANTDNKSVRQFAGDATVLVDPEAVFTNTYLSSAVPEVVEISKEGKLVARRSDLTKVDLASDFAALVAGQSVVKPPTPVVTQVAAVASGCEESVKSPYPNVNREFEIQILPLINNFRQQAGLSPLKLSLRLECLAELKAQQRYGVVDSDHLGNVDTDSGEMAKKLGYAGEVKGFFSTDVRVGTFPTYSQLFDRTKNDPLLSGLLKSKDVEWVGVGCTNGFAFDKSQGAAVCFVELGSTR